VKEYKDQTHWWEKEVGEPPEQGFTEGKKHYVNSRNHRDNRTSEYQQVSKGM
jgi:hypothetical protein